MSSKNAQGKVEKKIKSEDDKKRVDDNISDSEDSNEEDVKKDTKKQQKINDK